MRTRKSRRIPREAGRAPARSARFAAKAAFVGALLALCAKGFALEIVITEGGDNPTRIAVVPFGGPSLPGQDLAAIVAADLQRTGQFAALPSADMLSLPDSPQDVFFRDWRLLGMDYLLVARVSVAAGDPTRITANTRLALDYHLFDVAAERGIATARLAFTLDLARDAAHRVADDVYFAVTGVRGAFSTKILFVLQRDAGTGPAPYRLMLADADGHRERELFRSEDAILSPAWSPTADRVAYVSFETGRSTIVVQELATAERTRVAEYPGINGAPTFSPDGTRLAMSLSRDGNPEIYVKNLASGELRRVTRRPNAIDTEPVWSPDGESLIFTSDRGGKAQVYRKDLKTSFVERLTFEGDYNARARVLPDGGHLVYVHRREGVYRIAWQDLEKDSLRVLTALDQQTALDESPTLAPNGMMMIYATRNQGRGVLAAVSIDGHAKYFLPSQAGDVREPAWSPFLDGPELGGTAAVD